MQYRNTKPYSYAAALAARGVRPAAAKRILRACYTLHRAGTLPLRALGGY